MSSFARLDQHSFLKMQRQFRLPGYDRVMRDQQNRLSVLLDQALDEIHYLIRALAVQVASRLIAQEEGGVGNDRARNRHALFLSAGELSRDVMHPVCEADDGGQKIVFLVKDNHAERQAVKVGDTQGSQTQILAGVAAGDTVVVRGPADLKDGQAVQIKQ